ncbi:MAG: TIGR02757 family protein [Bacteroidetes bacterium]|nr:TIGR02757 family protein [Bacteroidota bacterium]
MYNQEEIHGLLDQKYEQFNRASFIETDPISIPHRFTKKEDIEIASFLISTIAWGQRVSIIRNGQAWMNLMDHEPHAFILNFSKKEEKRFQHFVHRTFNATDCIYFLKALKHIYTKHGGLEAAFSKGIAGTDDTIRGGIGSFREAFFELKYPERTRKHVSDPMSGSSAKRLCMFLRWMVRQDKKGVDFGIWKSISASQLCLPLDVHTGNVSRALGLLMRKQNDWKSVEEITAVLRTFDPNDPVKYDFALFGLGAFDKFR